MAYNNSVKSQNYIFSQTYSSPSIVSPSFTGMMGRDRIALNFRDQWPGLNKTFVTYAFTYEHYARKLNSGFGIQILKDRAGNGDLAVTSTNFLYAYDLKINRKWHLRPGISFTYAERSLDFYKLQFPDELITGNNQTIETGLTFQGAKYVDFNASVLGYNEFYWGGITVEHLLRPNQALNRTFEARIPMRFIALWGARIPIKKNSRRSKVQESVSFTALYRNQNMLDQFDIGAYYTKNPFVVGMWFRGFPIVSGFNRDVSPVFFESIILLAGFQVMDLSIGYSFDFTLSGLMGRSQGAHEVSIIYQFRNLKREAKSKYAAIPCPGF